MRARVFVSIDVGVDVCVLFGVFFSFVFVVDGKRRRARDGFGRDDGRAAPPRDFHQRLRGDVVHVMQTERRVVLAPGRAVQPVKRSHVVDEQQPATAAGTDSSLGSSDSSSRGGVLGRGGIGRGR